MIPRIIHFVWLGPMPEWAGDNIERFAVLNPDHGICIHRNADKLMPEYRDAYGHCPNVSAQSDLIRLSVLERHGGWYFDTDTYALRPVADIERANYIGNCLFVPASRGTAELSNPILAAPQTCRIWSAVHEFIANADLPSKDFLFFGTRLLAYLRLRHPSLIKLGRPGDFSVKGEGHLDTYNRLMAGEAVPTNAYAIHGFVGYGTDISPVQGRS